MRGYVAGIRTDLPPTERNDMSFDEAVESMKKVGEIISELKLPSAPDILESGAETYRERNKVYGDNYKQFGYVMDALFPAGYTAESPAEWNRLGLLIQIVNKLGRLTTDIDNPHIDSIHDIMVYAAMLEEICIPNQPQDASQRPGILINPQEQE